MAPDQRDGAGHGDAGIDEERHPSRRHMNVHNAYALALLIVRRRDEEAEDEPYPDRQHRQPAGPRQQPVGEAHKAARVGETVQWHVLRSPKILGPTNRPYKSAKKRA
jgi:hypothetical protein